MHRKTGFLKSLNAWTKHVQLYQNVFSYSLEQLNTGYKKEDEINAELFVILRDVCKKWSLEKEMESCSTGAVT